MKKGKRGLSTIVVTLIIILVSLVAVGIIWIVVRNVIQRGSEGIQMGQFTLDAKIKNVNMENNSNNVNLTVKRNPGEGAFTGLKFIFYDGRNSEVITQTVSLLELEEKRFNFHLNILNVSQLVSISIVPILSVNGKETIGNVLDKYTIRGSEQYQFICSPATCSALGYSCGTWLNGTCSGNLNCGNCSGGYICGSSGTCVSSCTPSSSCSALGYQCGIWGNGTCSGNLNCGNCSSGYSCNATGRCVLQTGGNITGNFRYVRAGATGSNNGSDWNNAYTTLPTTLLRNYTYYIADGDYAGYVFDDAVSGTQFITIKKATIANHGTSTGWDISYGDGQVVFRYWRVDTNYWIFDGQTRLNWISGYGIALAPQINDGHTLQFRYQPSNIVIQYVDMASHGLDTDVTDDVVYGLESGSYHSENIIFSYCYIHDSSRNLVTPYYWENSIFEYCMFARDSSDPTHAQGIQMSGGRNNTFRYNLWEDIEGTAYIAGVGTGAHIYDLKVYGNVFYYTQNNLTGRTGVGTGAITILDYNEAHGLRIYNNAFVNIPGYNSRISAPNPNSSDNFVYNNIWYNSVSANHVGMTADYNYYINTPHIAESNQQTGSSNPFVNWVNGNFHLASATNAGTSLPYPFNMDMDGNIRGSDGIWDRGAFEYVG